MKTNILYALDFDGVICNSAVETAITGWKVAQNIWPNMLGEAISDKHIQQFQEIRPCLEVGYEAILIMRILQQGHSMTPLCENYQSQLQYLIDEHNLDVNVLKDAFGKTRDNQIEEDEAGWIASNPVFEGLADKLKKLGQDEWVIVTTKQERFVKRILQGNGISLGEDRIFGLERKLSKKDVLKHLKIEEPGRRIVFIEDRLPTLLGVLDNPELDDIHLQLVDWGYNTGFERTQAQAKAIEVIGKNDFLRVL